MAREYLNRTALVTGSSGLIGSSVVQDLCGKGYQVIGVDNDSRSRYFGPNASTLRNRDRLQRLFPDKFIPINVDVTDVDKIDRLVRSFHPGIVAHTAAQPSHDWAGKSTKNIRRDFLVNAWGSVNLLCAIADYAPDAAVIITSTNKVYGDNLNYLPGLQEYETRYDFPEGHLYYPGIEEDLSIQADIHSFFGASKLAADVYGKEFGRYPGYGLNVGVFRGDCLTGPGHSGAPLHGFLNYIVRAVATGTPYVIEGYKGKQVRDNMHSEDVTALFWEFILNPRPGEIYNLAGGRGTDVSVLEALEIAQEFLGQKAIIQYSPQARAGDHIWCVASMQKARSHFPGFVQKHSSVRDIIREQCEAVLQQLHPKTTLSNNINTCLNTAQRS